MRKDFSGRRFGMLVALAYSHSANQRAYWFCVCDCGTFCVRDTARFFKLRSCGCGRSVYQIALKTKHGKRFTRAYKSWAAMKSRALNVRCPDYSNYGGRGILICERWLSFENFYADMGERPEGRTLDRIDNNRNYEPGNCRWASRLEQNRNRRPRRWMKKPSC